MTFTLLAISSDLDWKNDPLDWQVEQDGILTITAGENTDLFIDPQGEYSKDTAPAAFFAPQVGDFLLGAKVEVDFGSTYDAGALWVYDRDDLWAKLCFEFSPRQQPMVVSVVTRGVSDDCNSTSIDGKQVYLRIARVGRTFAFHYSMDGRFWHLVRYFALGKLHDPRVGFSSQSPTGEKCTAVFSEISYRQETLKDIRNGE